MNQRPPSEAFGTDFHPIRDKLARFGGNFRRDTNPISDQLHPVVAPHELHFRHDPFRTIV
jgi:hypothetical protein